MSASAFLSGERHNRAKLDRTISIRVCIVQYSVTSVLEQPESAAKRNPDANPLPILLILPAKEADEKLLLMDDAAGEEAPQGDSIADKADDVTQHELGAERPPEEAKVARVAEPGVDAPGDEGV